MIRQKSNFENEINTKKKKLDDEDVDDDEYIPIDTERFLSASDEQSVSNTDSNEAAAGKFEIPDSNEEQSPDIYRIPVELMTDIFKFLPLADLNSVCQTSKWWQKIANLCYQQDYSWIFASYLCDQLETTFSCRFDAFKSLVKYLYFSFTSDFQYFVRNEFAFRQLTNVKLHRIHLNEIEFECMKPILSKLEWLCMTSCETNTNIIDLMPNLKVLHLIDPRPMHEWLKHKYPTLERFGIQSFEHVFSILPIPTFLKLNPNILWFETNAKHLLDNSIALKTSRIKLDVMAVIMTFELGSYYPYLQDMIKLNAICQLLNELHEIGIYKRLHLYVNLSWKFDPAMMVDISSLKALNKLYIEDSMFVNNDPIYPLATLREIEELYISDSSDITDIEAVASNLVNLKRLHIRSANLDHIVHFITRTQSIEKIKINNLNGHDVINLPKLNRARLKLPNARKVIIYVSENAYLAKKRAILQTSLELIEWQHSTSIEWDHSFGLVH